MGLEMDPIYLLISVETGPSFEVIGQGEGGGDHLNHATSYRGEH